MKNDDEMDPFPGFVKAFKNIFLKYIYYWNRLSVTTKFPYVDED